MTQAMDRDAYLDRLGVDLEPGGREPAPPPLRVVQRFVNSYNHELEVERDRLGSADKATRWLVDNALLARGVQLSVDDTRRLRGFREVIRDLAGASPGSVTVVGADLGVSLRVRIGHGPSLRFEPTGSPLERIVGTLAAIVHEAMIDGSWQRMKLCRECSWLFFDNSRNRSGGWCSMAICGNRSKNRSYRRRSGQ